MRLRAIATCTTILTIALGWNMMAQGHPQAAETFSRLLAPKTTDKATEELLRSAKTDPATRRYLSEHLPAVIEKGPKVYGEPWLNAVRLSGELKVTEAVPALSKWIKTQTGGDLNGTLTLSRSLRLQYNPAAKALSQIGDPAVPTLAGILEHGLAEERSLAAGALWLIRSPAAQTVLQEQMNHEQDPQMKDLIKNILDHWKPAS